MRTPEETISGLSTPSDAELSDAELSDVSGGWGMNPYFGYNPTTQIPDVPVENLKNPFLPVIKDPFAK